MKLKVEKHNPFLCPPGYQPAVCTGLWPLTERAADGQEMVRLGFAVFPNAGDPTRQYKAGKNYPASLTYGSALWEDLENWLGEDFLTKEEEFDTDQLVGKAALLLIKHYHNDGWDHPYVSIAHIARVDEAAQAKAAEPVGQS